MKTGRPPGNSSAFHYPARDCLADAGQSRVSHGSDCGLCRLCACFCCYEAERLNSNVWNCARVMRTDGFTVREVHLMIDTRKEHK